MRSRPDLASWASDLARPVPLAAAAVLAVNDHLLKGAGLVPAAITGKLSDVAGLLLAGVVAVALARGAVGAVTGALPRRDRRLGVGALTAVGLGFAALKLWPGFNRALTAAWGVNVLDPSDLWALPMLAVAWLWLRDREVGDGAAPPRRFVSGLALIAALLACAATSAPPPVPPPAMPGWAVGEDKLEVPCGQVEAWVSKSGKTGAGLTVQVTRAADVERCDVTIVGATLRFRDGAVAGQEIPLSELLATSDDPDDGRYARPPVAAAPVALHYLGFAFDNQARWNRGDRDATFELVLELGGEQRTWTVAAHHAWRQFPVEKGGRYYR